MADVTSRIVQPTAGDWWVEIETEHLDLRYGPYPTVADAEAVLARLVVALGGVTDRQGGYVAGRGRPAPGPQGELF